MKGIEISTGRRLSQVAADNLDPGNQIAVWLGPGHVQTLYQGVPTCMVIDSADEETKRFLVDAFSSELIRFYYGTDLIGNEIGGAAKNVMGIAAGMLDGVGKTQMKGPLMSRGTYEVGKLIAAMGGAEMSAYGLCHLGDYEATLFSEHSHNRKFGELFVQGAQFDKLAEGYYTADAMVRLADQYGVEMPITRAVYEILYHGAAPDETLNKLFSRQIKREF
jgi:glycerol-3-phosphate dehydrogenase (NAD(P)+)